MPSVIRAAKTEGYESGAADRKTALRRHHIQLSGCYLLLAFTGARAAEIVDNEKRRPKDGTYEDIYGPKSVRIEDSGYDSDQPVDDNSRLLENMLYQETISRGRPKTLCYEDICLSVVRHPQTGMDVLTMAVKFIHHKGVDRKPKPSVTLTCLDVSLSRLTLHRTIFFFSGTRRLLFCIITVIVSSGGLIRLYFVDNFQASAEQPGQPGDPSDETGSFHCHVDRI